MAQLNSVILMGNLTAAPTLRQTDGGKDVANFSIAVSGRGERPTTYVDVTAWNQPARFIAEKASKGALVAVEGRLELQSWEGEQGKRSKLVVVADNVQLAVWPEKANSSSKDADKGKGRK